MNKNQLLTINNFDPETRKRVFPKIPLLSTEQLPLNGVKFEYFHCSGDNDKPAHTIEHHLICISYTKAETERKLDGVFQKEQQNLGAVGIAPAKAEHRIIWQENMKFALFSIQPETLAQIAPENINPDKIELLPTFAHSQDNLLSSMGIAIKQQLEMDADGCGFYLEHLFNALSAHLVQNYCSITPVFKQYGDGLSPYKLKLALDYINDNLDRPIKLNDIAKFLDISQYYFCHMFKESTGVSPYRYIIQQRVARAQNLIKNSQLSLSDIAYECGFSSQSQMTQHFRKLVGVTPRVYFLKIQ